MAGITSSSKAVALVAGVMLAMVALAESKCELLDHEPVMIPQSIDFPGGKMTFQASLVFVKNGDTKKYVALRTISDKADYARPKPSKHIVKADFDCAKIEFQVSEYPVDELNTIIDYSATMPGKPCEAFAVALDDALKVRSPKGPYVATSCEERSDGLKPELAIRNIKFEFEGRYVYKLGDLSNY